MTTVWMIGVLIEAAPGPPVRQFFAVAQDDQARAEWAAADLALKEGAIASRPCQGMEPIETVSALSQRALLSLGIAPGEARALGWKPPRRWLVA